MRKVPNALNSRSMSSFQPIDHVVTGNQTIPHGRHPMLGGNPEMSMHAIRRRVSRRNKQIVAAKMHETAFEAGDHLALKQRLLRAEAELLDVHDVSFYEIRGILGDSFL